jgi:hypothetical protein
VIFGPLCLALLQGVSGTLPDVPASGPSLAGVIAVILPNAPNPSMLEALHRLRGEADSVGLELRLVEGLPESDPRAQLDRVARSLAPAAVVALVGETDGAPPPPSALATPEAPATPKPGPAIASIDVWFLDRTTGGMSVGHLTVDQEAGARADLLLAVRVVDFIRARMFDSLVRAQAEAKARRVPPVTHELAGRRFVAAGIGGTGSFSGFDAAFLPMLELGHAVTSWLRLTASAAGFGSTPRQETPAGRASMDQKLLKLGAMFLARPRWRLQGFAAAAATAYFLSVHGVGFGGNVGYHPSSWSPGAEASAGLCLVLSRHIALQLGGGALLLLREPKVYLADTQVARTGRPAWLAHALLGAVF